MRCVAIDGSGFVVDVNPQPASVDSCTLVLASPSEVGSSPFAIPEDQAGPLVAACGLVLATAFVYRVIIRQLPM